MGRENDLKKVKNWTEKEDDFLPKLSNLSPFYLKNRCNIGRKCYLKIGAKLVESGAKLDSIPGVPGNKCGVDFSSF